MIFNDEMVGGRERVTTDGYFEGVEQRSDC